MAQTRKRRRTKHRGNAAGMVEARGRTGRRPDENEKKPKGVRQDAAARRQNRLAEPPTWRSAFNRSAAMSVLFAVLLVLLLKRTVPQAVVIAVLMLSVYVPMTYYIDLGMHRRYLRKHSAKAKAG